MRRVLALLFAVLLGLGGVTPGAGAAGLVPVSGPSPFGRCPADVRLPAGAVEPHVAANPVAPDNLVALWTQDRFNGLVAGVSFDRGRTWRRIVVPGTSRCTGGPYGNVDEAWLTFGPTGVVHLTGKVFGSPEVPSGLITARSGDGGRSWYFLGDYAGLTHIGRDFVTVFAQPRGSDPAVISGVRVPAR